MTSPGVMSESLISPKNGNILVSAMCCFVRHVLSFR